MSTVASGLSEISPRRRLWMTIAVMAATIMQVLDTTIVNVALPTIQGQLAASPAQIGWVLTSYIVAAGIFMTLTGYLTDRLGQRTYITLSIFGFTLMSVMCGLATNLTELILFRVLQGVFGASLVPMAQSILVQAYPPHERARAMAIWSVGVMVGPILGPSLGGWLTEVFSWRWTFFVNLPIGIASGIIAWQVIPESARKVRAMDWSGFALMVMALGGLQMVLDRGTAEDWYSSNSIRLFTLISAVGFIGFIWHGLTAKATPLFNLRIFMDRNFATASMMMIVLGAGLYGTMILVPLMLEGLMHYPASSVGLLMMPRGFASMLAMVMAARLLRIFDAKLIVAVGIALYAMGSLFAAGYNLEIDSYWIVMPALWQGFGLGLVLVPLSTLALSTLPPQYLAESAGIYSLMRTLGQAFGISAVTMLVSRHTQIAWNQLGGGLQATSPAVQLWADKLSMSSDSAQLPLVLAKELGRQSQMLAFVDAYLFIACSFVLVAPLLMLFRSSKPAVATT
ncbi:MAG: DHA2 family multidrug resistance protein [Zhongshania sp.]|jgi:DHA2 family multidrug resistance protein